LKIGAEIESAAQQLVEGGVEIQFRGLEVAGAIVILPCLVFFFDAGDQLANGIDFKRLRNLRLRLGLGGGGFLLMSRRPAGRYHGWSLSLSGRHER